MSSFKRGQRVKFDVYHPLTGDKQYSVGTGTVTFVDAKGQPRIQPDITLRPGSRITNIRGAETK